MGALEALTSPLKMNLGFSFEETMSGTYHLLDSPLVERAISFSIGARVKGIRQFLRDKNARIQGVVDIEGFADKRPLEGTLGLKLLDERRLVYDFTFRANDGQSYRFHGQKDVTAVGLYDTMTTLPASLYDLDGRELARATLRFDVQQNLRPFLKSWRLRYGTWTD
jgi:hypothetical protein